MGLRPKATARRARSIRSEGAAILAAVALVAGCGGDERSDRQQIEATLTSLQTAVAAGDWETACAALGSKPVHQIGTVGHKRRPTTCERDLRAFFTGMDDAADLELEPRPDLRGLARPRVVSVKVAGDRAVVSADLDGDPLDIPFVREDGGWKLDDFFVTTGPVRPDLR